MNVQGSIMKKAKIIQSDNLQNCFVFLFTFRHLYFKIRKYIVYLQKIEGACLSRNLQNQDRIKLDKDNNTKIEFYLKCTGPSMSVDSQQLRISFSGAEVYEERMLNPNWQVWLKYIFSGSRDCLYIPITID